MRQGIKSVAKVLAVGLAFVSFLSHSASAKTITAKPGIPVTALTTWYIINCSTSGGVGTYSINVAPKHGTVTFADVSGPAPGCPAGSPPLPAVQATYTWTDTTYGPTTDYFELNYNLFGYVYGPYDINVTLSCPQAPPEGTESQVTRTVTPEGMIVITSVGSPDASPESACTPPQLDFFYDSAHQNSATELAQGNFTIDAPVVHSSDFHSLSELAVESTDGKQIVEVGWTVDNGLNGDSNPHLFVFHWVNGQVTCYNGCGFVPVSTSVKAGMALTPGTSTKFSIKYYEGRWWIYALGEWVGYFPGSLWKDFTEIGIVQWFGEVAASSKKPTTQMGDGILGTRANSADILDMSFIDPSTGKVVLASASTLETDASFYAIGKFTGYSFNYGGPGAK